MHPDGLSRRLGNPLLRRNGHCGICGAMSHQFDFVRHAYDGVLRRRNAAEEVVRESQNLTLPAGSPLAATPQEVCR
jgi:hypothetical protein